MRSSIKLALAALASFATGQTFEAELGTLSQYLYVDTAVSGYTGTGYVTNFTGTTDLLTININGLATAGLYDLSIRYSAPYGSKYTSVSVNGAPTVEASLPNVTGSVWLTSLVGSYELTTGTNTVTMDDDWGWFLIDSITVAPPPIAPIVSVNVTLGATVQAENGTFTGSVGVATATAGYTGTGYVQGFYAAGDTLTVTLFSQTEALYNLVIRYAAIYGYKQTTMTLNGGSGAEVIFADTSTAASPWANATGGQVLLNAGNNTITFSVDWGYYFIDALYVTPAPPPPPHNITKLLVTPDALPVTYKLYHTLLSKYGSGDIFSGQAGTDGVAWIQANLNTTPAIIGLDMMDYSPSRVLYQGNISTDVPDAIAFDATGGIVAFQWHWNAPTDLINNATVPWWSGFYTYATTFNLTAALANTNGTDYALLLSDMDTIAYELLALQNAGVPVIWRPLHEAEGGWFWWGAYGPESCIALYRLMYNRFTTVHQLRNLIWLWNSVNPSWYPGADVVDILGYDSYPPIGDHGPVSVQYQDLIALGLDQKMVTLPEVGNIPDPSILKLYHADWSYFVTWSGDYISNDTYNPLAFKQQVYDDPTVLKLKDLGNWKGTTTTKSTQSSTATKTSSSSTKTSSTTTTTSKTSTSKTSSKTSSKISSTSVKTTSTTSKKTTTSTHSSTTSSSTPPAPHWGQCGGIGFPGPYTCVSPYVCTVLNPYYSQCL